MGETVPIITNPPFIKPDAPMPAIARPTINMMELWAAPQMRDPISKIERNTMNVICLH